jgi:hypothetical protein
VKYAAFHGATVGCLRLLIFSIASKRLRKTLCSGQKCLYFQSHLLCFKHIEHWKAAKDAPCKAAYFTYEALNILMNIGGLNCGNRLAKTGTEPACPGFSWNRFSRNSPKMGLLLTLPKPDHLHTMQIGMLDHLQK